MNKMNPPSNPFVQLDDASGTQIRIDSVLAFIQDYQEAKTQDSSLTPLPGKAHIHGFSYVIEALRGAVEYLGAMAEDNGQVHKLEAKS